MVGSLFSMDAWNNVGFASGELKHPEKDVPFAMGMGVLVVTTLYVLANVGYLNVLPAGAIATAPQDRVGTAALQAMFGSAGLYVMAVAIMISTFGCNNGLILSGARVYYAMARDNLFFLPKAGELHPTYRTPVLALWTQAADERAVLPGTYGQLLDYISSPGAVLHGDGDRAVRPAHSPPRHPAPGARAGVSVAAGAVHRSDGADLRQPAHREAAVHVARTRDRRARRAGVFRMAGVDRCRTTVSRLTTSRSLHPGCLDSAVPGVPH
jgi:hypothetical protein